MSTQISLKLSDKMFAKAKKWADVRGFDNLQDFIRETLRQKLFEDKEFGSHMTMIASEPALARHWLTEEEDRAWQHLQKGK